MKNIKRGCDQNSFDGKTLARLFLLIITLGLYSLTLSAESITEDEAKDKARQFLLGRDGVSQRGGRVAPVGAVSQLRTAEAKDAFFVFNVDSAGGFVVVSGDDRMPAVLGYSYSGKYKSDDIPDNMRAWLEGYAEQYEYLKTHSEAEAVSLTSVSGGKISPLLSCQWNQGSPYNDKCPKINGRSTLTGCVATAMAQIMYYHQWPKQTTKTIPGYISYTNKLSIPDIDVTSIDWDNMLPSYSSYGTSRQNDAIATLMYLCGASVEMNYGLSESGASTWDAADAFGEYFDYDPMNISKACRNNYTSDVWNQLIYDELRAKRPVLYSGQSKNSGHAFVVDGYDGNDYFHVNWGWGGYQDYYFLLSALRDYNYDQDAVIGIENPTKPEHGTAYSVLENGTLTFYCDKDVASRHGKVYRKLPDPWGEDREYLENSDEITSVVFDPSFADVHNITSTCGMFRGLSNLLSIRGLEYLDTEYVTDMSFMFYNCNTLSSLDVSGFNTQNVTDMRYMFGECQSLTSLDVSGFDTQYVTDMGFMFFNCKSLSSLDVSGFDTQNVTNMYCLFSGCNALTSLDVSGFDTQDVTDMSLMFDQCESLTSLDLSGFDTQNVTNMYSMFSGCSALTSLNLSGFNTQKVTDMSFMFSNCNALTSLDLSGFNTQNVTDMRLMFGECQSLTSLDVSGFNTQKVTDMRYMFDECQSLTSLDVSGFNTLNVTDMRYMFYNCKSLTSLDVSGFNTQNVSDMRYMFFNCQSLNSVKMGEKMTSLGNYAFAYCSNIQDFTCFAKNSPTLGTNVFYGIPLEDATLYVFQSSIDEYKSASQWNAFGQILPIDEHATSITLDISENKILIDESFVLTPTVLPAYASSKLTWKSSDPEVAAVDDSGVVRGVAAGTSTITATTTDGTDLSATCQVTVEPYFLKGKCGTNLSYVLDDQYVLTITGTGSMNSYTSSYQPWKKYADKIVSVCLPEGITSIGSYAFSGCSAVKSVEIPENVTYIGSYAFQNCSAIETFTCKANRIPNMGNNVFSGMNQSDATLIVKDELLGTYKKTSQWKEFGTIIAFEDLLSPLQYYTYDGEESVLSNKSDWEAQLPNTPNAIALADSEHKNWATRHRNVLVKNTDDTYKCADFLLTDLSQGYISSASVAAKTGFYTPVSFTATKGEYKRQAYAGYNTLCLPFSFKASELSSSAKVFTFDSYDEDKTKVIFKAVSGTIEAGTPCIVKEKTDVEWTVNLAGKTIAANLPNEDSYMRGTYVTTDVYQGKGYAPRSTDNKFAPLTQYLHPFRACLLLEEQNDADARGSISVVFMDEDGATVIDEINATVNVADVPKAIYTLSGQRVNEVKRSGLYIVNGKKQYIEVK